MTEKLKLFISNIPQNWDEQSIVNTFDKVASVLEVSLFKDNEVCKNYLALGCAYVLFEKKAEALEVAKNYGKPLVRLPR